MQINIKHDDLKDGKVLTLLAEHHRQMQLYSPPESIHALNQAQFFDPALTFWGAWDGDSLAACGAVKQLSETAGEIKAMRTEPKYIRRSRQYAVLSLETGAHEAFVPAIRLYQKFGFVECEPFGDYQPDPYSRFFSLKLNTY